MMLPYTSLLGLLALSSVATTAYSTNPIDHARNTVSSQSWLSRARDSVIKSIWQIPSGNDSPHPNGEIPFRSTAPATLQTRYGGDVVLRFEIRTKEEATALSEAVNTLLLDVWEFTDSWVDVRLSKDVVDSLLGLLPASLQHAHTPLMHDLAQAIYESYPSPAFSTPSLPSPEGARPFSPDLRAQRDETNIFFRDYQPLSVITPWLRLLRSLFPTHVRLISIGTSYEGRDIPALRVGVHPTNSEKPSEPRKTIIVAGGSHAREWISTSTVNYVAYSFITAYGRDRDITKLLEKFDFLFVPTLNPDGYAYTWESDRLWRKNRQQTSLRFCKGLDLDRAYEFHWDSEAASDTNPCSESFSGESPFEAIEARRFAQFVRNETQHNNVEVVGYLDLHSYSQQILYPYSYSCVSSPPNLEDLEELAIGLAKAIRLTNGERYGVTSACEGSIATASGAATKPSNVKAQKAHWPRMETGGGSALDWMYHEMNVRHSFQLKLRDKGSYGFLLPSENIVPTGKETFRAVQHFAQFLNGNRGIEEGDDAAVSDDAILSPFSGHKASHSDGHDGDDDDIDDEWVLVEASQDDETEAINVPSTELKRRRR